MNDTKRYCSIWCARAYLLNVRDTKDYKHPAVIVLVTGALVSIADVGKKIIG